MGSQNLVQTSNLNTLLYQTALPFHTLPITSSHSLPPSSSPQALEALRTLANLLVLHPTGRTRFAKAGGGRAIARALAGAHVKPESIEQDEGEREPMDMARLFLLGRIGFLVTMEQKAVVKGIVDEEDIVNSLAYVCLFPCNGMGAANE